MDTKKGDKTVKTDITCNKCGRYMYERIENGLSRIQCLNVHCSFSRILLEKAKSQKNVTKNR